MILMKVLFTQSVVVSIDRDLYQAPGINAEMPVVPDYEFQVEQPKNTAYSLKGVSVL